MRFSEGPLALECAHRCLACMSRRVLRGLALERFQRPFRIDGDSDLLGQAMIRGFRSLLGRRHVERSERRVCAAGQLWDCWCPCVDNRRVLHSSSL